MTIYVVKIRKNGIKLNATKFQYNIEKNGCNSSGKVTRIYDKNGIKTFYMFSGFPYFSNGDREIICAFVGKDNEDLKKIKSKLMAIAKRHGIQ
jgi:hypothetical protein